MLKYTLTEIKKHNQATDCWLVINNKVYDLSVWINSHSGGKDAVIKACGSDATEYFQTKAGSGTHSAYAHQKISDFLIGELK